MLPESGLKNLRENRINNHYERKTSKAPVQQPDHSGFATPRAANNGILLPSGDREGDPVKDWVSGYVRELDIVENQLCGAGSQLEGRCRGS